MDTGNSKRVCVLGGGVTGLAAAHHLAGLGDLDVAVLEQGACAGGLARTVRVDRCWSDLGPHRFNTELPQIDRFVRELTASSLLRVPRRSRMLLGGKLVHYPPRPLELLGSFGTARTIGFVGSFLTNRLAETWRRGTVDSFEDAMRVAFGPDLYTAIIHPYATKFWGIEPSELSVDVARTRVSAGGIGKLLRKLVLGQGTTHLDEFTYFKGGTRLLVEALVEQLRSRGAALITGARVTRLAVGADGAAARIGYECNGESAELEVDACISTLPLTKLCAMLLEDRPDDTTAGALAELRFIRMACVLVEVCRPSITDNSWLYFPERHVWMNRAYEAKNFDPSMCPEDRSIICAEVGMHDDSRWELADEAIADRVISEMVDTGLFARTDVAGSAVYRIPFAYPVHDRAYRRRLSLVWNYLRQFPQVLTTGRQGLFHHNNMDHSILMGRQAAECVAEHARPARPWYDSLGQFDDLRIID